MIKFIQLWGEFMKLSLSKITRPFLAPLFLALPCLAILPACGDRASEGSAVVQMAFANAAVALKQSLNFITPKDVRTLTTEAATAFQMKLIAVYLTEDIDPDTGSNIGATALVYLNEECEDDISHCDISTGPAEDGTDMAHIISTYFDFAQSSADVNAAINAQGNDIDVGTYKYARLEFCKYNAADSENIKWNSTSVAAEQSFQRDQCTVNSAEFAEPIVLADGDTTTVTLGYDISETVAITTRPDGCDDSVDIGSGNFACFGLPSFVPSAE